LSVPVAEKPAPIELGPADTLKLSFTVVAKDQGEVKGVQPHQTFVRFLDKSSGEEGIVPVRVAQSGKAKFELVRTPYFTYSSVVIFGFVVIEYVPPTFSSSSHSSYTERYQPIERVLDTWIFHA
jgi:hypothetical protein